MTKEDHQREDRRGHYERGHGSYKASLGFPAKPRICTPPPTTSSLPAVGKVRPLGNLAYRRFSRTEGRCPRTNLDFITLYRTTGSNIYLQSAARLTDVVHSALGRTRSFAERLRGASDGTRVAGGLHIGGEDENGPNGDGQYDHYLTFWMCVASGEKWYSHMAVKLAKTILQLSRLEWNSPGHGCSGEWLALLFVARGASTYRQVTVSSISKVLASGLILNFKRLKISHAWQWNC